MQKIRREDSEILLLVCFQCACVYSSLWLIGAAKPGYIPILWCYVSTLNFTECGCINKGFMM